MKHGQKVQTVMENLLDYASITLGVALLLFGWLLYRMALGLAGGILGGGLGLAIGRFAFEATGASPLLAGVGTLLLGLFGLLIGVALFRAMNSFLVFMVGLFFGGWFAFGVIVGLRNALPDGVWGTDLFAAVVSPVFGLVVGGFAVAFQNYLIALLASIAGAILVCQPLDWPFGGLGALGALVLGFLVQIALMKKDEDDDDE